MGEEQLHLTLTPILPLQQPRQLIFFALALFYLFLGKG